MKRTFVVIAWLTLFWTGTVLAKEGGSLKDTKYLGGAAGIDLPLQDWNPNYPTGLGGEAVFGYYFEEDLAVQIEVNAFLWPGDKAKTAGILTNINDIKVTPELKFVGGGQGVEPFVLIGAGVDTTYVNFVLYSNSTTSADILGGAGLQFDLDPKTWFFVEGKYNLTFMNGGTRQDLPFLAGLLFKL
jgi:hypothetical protein